MIGLEDEEGDVKRVTSWCAVVRCHDLSSVSTCGLLQWAEEASVPIILSRSPRKKHTKECQTNMAMSIYVCSREQSAFKLINSDTEPGLIIAWDFLSLFPTKRQFSDMIRPLSETLRVIVSLEDFEFLLQFFLLSYFQNAFDFLPPSSSLQRNLLYVSFLCFHDCTAIQVIFSKQFDDRLQQLRAFVCGIDNSIDRYCLKR